LSVRRLSTVQPESFEFSKESLEKAQWWMAKYPSGRQQSAVIALLWLVQKQEGWVSEPAIRVVSEMLGMPKIRVLEVATFYTMFHLEPVGETVVQVCGTTPCQLRGSEALMDVCKRKIGPKEHRSADGKLYWQEVECMGAFEQAPMALEKLIDQFAAGEKPAPGSALGRRGAAPEGGPLVLQDPSLYDGSRAKPYPLPNAAKEPAE
jgi:NADH-quinone oxidoreductase subunit E